VSNATSSDKDTPYPRGGLVSEAAIGYRTGKPMHAADVRRDPPAMLAGDLGKLEKLAWLLQR